MKQQSNYKRRPGNKGYVSPYSWYFWLALLLTGGLAALLAILKLPVYLAYIVAINLVTFGFYGFDKLRAKRAARRIPELILHYLAILGGAIGGLAGQWLFRHKIRKQIFHVILWSSLLLHIIIFVVFYKPLLDNSAWQTFYNWLSSLLNSKGRR